MPKHIKATRPLEYACIFSLDLSSKEGDGKIGQNTYSGPGIDATKLKGYYNGIRYSDMLH